MLRRASLYKELDTSLQTMAFNNIQEARDFALNRKLNENKIKLLQPNLPEQDKEQLLWENEKLQLALTNNSHFLEDEQIDIEELSA